MRRCIPGCRTRIAKAPRPCRRCCPARFSIPRWSASSATWPSPTRPAISTLARGTLLALGAFSLFVAALFIVRQTGVKRLMAYSSVEHMGVIALGFGFGGPLGVAGALYHMLNHSLNKSAMFFGAGSVMRAYGTKRIRSIRSVMLHFPVIGGLWLAIRNETV